MSIIQQKDITDALLPMLRKQPLEWLGLPSVRKRALEFYETTEIPSRQTEDWRYTDVDGLFASNVTLSMPEQSKTPAKKVFKKSDLKGDNRFEFRNGYLKEDFLTNIENGLIIEPLHSVSKEYAPLVHRYFDKTGMSTAGKLESLNTAFANTGYFIYVKPGTVLEHPIALTHRFSALRQFSQERNLLVIGKGASVKMEDDFFASKSGYISNNLTEIFLEDDAVLEHNILQNFGETDTLINTIAVHQSRNSTYTNNVFVFDGGVVRNSITVWQNDEFCNTNLNGLFIAHNENHFDLFTQVHHNHPNGTTRELYKGLANDKATGIFTGKIRVAPGAVKTQAYQSNRNILLSEEATIHSKPLLEIFADDVSCTHGSTCGQINPDALFYCQSRGIDHDTAVHLLLESFTDEVLQKISIPEFKEYIHENMRY